MPRDPRAYITVHNGFPEHRKVDPLSDSAFRAVIEAWCFCSRTQNDGVIPMSTWTKKWKPKARRELLESGLAYIDGTNVRMHDYLEHQSSAAHIQATRTKRAEAGRKGGLRKAENLANGVASARQNAKPEGSPDVPEVEVEVEKRSSTHVDPAASLSSARGTDERGPVVPAEGWKLVRSTIPDTHPQAVRTDLAVRAGALTKSGTPPETVEAALRLWLTKPNLGPGVLPSLVSEVLKTQQSATPLGRTMSTADKRVAEAQSLRACLENAEWRKELE